MRVIVYSLLSALLLSSCLNDLTDQEAEEAQAKYESYLQRNNYTADEQIGYGVYVRLAEGADATNPKPKTGQTVLLQYDGYYTNNTLFETTDSAKSIAISYRDVVIFGPKRHKVGTLIWGFDTAIRTVPEGAAAQIVIPYQYAFGNYEPVVYDVELLEIIENDSAWESETFLEFAQANGFDTSRYISTAKGLLYKTFGDDSLRTDPVLKLNDAVYIKLTARYAETYYDNNLGRVFYPRKIEADTITYLYGSTTKYPITDAIDSAVKYMRKGQVLEIAFLSGAEASKGYQWGYGANGVIDNNYNITIISPYTPLHYRIELDSTAREK